MKSGIRAILQNILEMDEEGIKRPWMKSGAKLHSFIRAIVGCSLANIHFRKMRGTNKSQK
jgi:hypothetical protein